MGLVLSIRSGHKKLVDEPFLLLIPMVIRWLVQNSFWFGVFFTDFEPRRRYIISLVVISIICSIYVIYYEISTRKIFAQKSRFWILMIFFTETLQFFMMAQYFYEFYESKLKLKQWEFEYFRDLEIKKVIHNTN